MYVGDNTVSIDPFLRNFYVFIIEVERNVTTSFNLINLHSTIKRKGKER